MVLKEARMCSPILKIAIRITYPRRAIAWSIASSIKSLQVGGGFEERDMDSYVVMLSTTVYSTAR